MHPDLEIRSLPKKRCEAEERWVTNSRIGRCLHKLADRRAERWLWTNCWDVTEQILWPFDLFVSFVPLWWWGNTDSIFKTVHVLKIGPEESAGDGDDAVCPCAARPSAMPASSPCNSSIVYLHSHTQSCVLWQRYMLIQGVRQRTHGIKS